MVSLLNLPKYYMYTTSPGGNMRQQTIERINSYAKLLQGDVREKTLAKFWYDTIDELEVYEELTESTDQTLTAEDLQEFNSKLWWFNQRARVLANIIGLLNQEYTWDQAINYTTTTVDGWLEDGCEMSYRRWERGVFTADQHSEYCMDLRIDHRTWKGTLVVLERRIKRVLI
jgi:hypothetical protein